MAFFVLFFTRNQTQGPCACRQARCHWTVFTALRSVVRGFAGAWLCGSGVLGSMGMKIPKARSVVARVATDHGLGSWERDNRTDNYSRSKLIKCWIHFFKYISYWHGKWIVLPVLKNRQTFFRKESLKKQTTKYVCTYIESRKCKLFLALKLFYLHLICSKSLYWKRPSG